MYYRSGPLYVVGDRSIHIPITTTPNEKVPYQFIKIEIYSKRSNRQAHSQRHTAGVGVVYNISVQQALWLPPTTNKYLHSNLLFGKCNRISIDAVVPVDVTTVYRCILSISCYGWRISFCCCFFSFVYHFHVYSIGKFLVCIEKFPWKRYPHFVYPNQSIPLPTFHIYTYSASVWFSGIAEFFCLSPMLIHFSFFFQMQWNLSDR